MRPAATRAATTTTQRIHPAPLATARFEAIPVATRCSSSATRSVVGAAGSLETLRSAYRVTVLDNFSSGRQANLTSVLRKLPDGTLVVEEIKSVRRGGGPAPAVLEIYQRQALLYAWMLRRGGEEQVAAELVLIEIGSEEVDVSGSLRDGGRVEIIKNGTFVI